LLIEKTDVSRCFKPSNGCFYDKQNKDKKSLGFYNTSLKKTDQYLVASNYRNIANMYFRTAAYPVAAKYYDSTLVNLDLKSREFIHRKLERFRQ
jgi:hypothetical protein